MSGRRLTWLAAILCTALLGAAACGSGESTDAGSGDKPYEGVNLVYATPGPGSYEDAEVGSYVKPFEKKTGAKVVLTVENDAKLTAMARAGNVSWNVTDSSPPFTRNYCGDVVQPIDIKGVKGSFPKGSISKCGRPSVATAALFMYNADTYKNNPPSKLADFFDPKKYPGTRVMPDQSDSGYFEYALLADGADINNLYPLDTDRAMKMFDKIQSSAKITPTGSQEQQLMLNKQADMAIVPSTRAYSVLKAGGENWKIMKTPAILHMNEWAIPKGAQNVKAAKDFVKFASQPAQQKKFAELCGGLTPANQAVKPKYTGLAAKVNPASFTPNIWQDQEYWSKNYDKLTSLFHEWSTT